jgi:SM-20-related protein
LYATQVGLFARRDFLPERLCAEVREHIKTARAEAGTILKGAQSVVNRKMRMTEHAITPWSIRRPVIERIRALLPELGNHFNVTVNTMTDLQFLRYGKGDFFKFHRDRDDRLTDEPAFVRARKVSVVIFLNTASELPAPDSYGGGELQFFVPDLRTGSANVKFSFPAAAGTLVAFDPRVLHQVRPVTHGQRYTIVCWCV